MSNGIESSDSCLLTYSKVKSKQLDILAAKKPR